MDAAQGSCLWAGTIADEPPEPDGGKKFRYTAFVMTRTPRSLADAAVFAAPAVFVLLWASGFIGAKLGLPYAEPMTFLTVRMSAVVLVLGADHSR